MFLDQSQIHIGTFSHLCGAMSILKIELFLFWTKNLSNFVFISSIGNLTIHNIDTYSVHEKKRPFKCEMCGQDFGMFVKE